MKFLNWVVTYLLFGMPLYFAAGSPTLTDAGDGGGADLGAGLGDSSGSDGADDLGYGSDVVDDVKDDAAIDDAPVDDQQDQPDLAAKDKEEPELGEFKGSVSARLRGLAKQAPELAAVFQKYPKIQEQIEATFRREAALREVFPTVAEARQMREQFPNGLSDVQTLLSDVQELEGIDKNLFTRDADGHYSGHAAIVNKLFSDDREATVALFRNLPKEWARLDRDSYNEVMGKIVGATLAQREIPEFIGELIESAKEAKQDGLAASLGKLLNWANGYTKEKGRPSPEEERLTSDRQKFNREKQDRDKETHQQFHRSFVSESRKIQLDTISKHPAMQRLAKVQGITPEKRNQIAEQIRQRMEKLLGKSPSFMRKLRPAYEGRNLQETLALQKTAWSQQWLLNKMVREVLRVETPNMVSNNRESVRRRAGTPAAKQTDKTSDKGKPTGPHKVGNIWYKADGSKFTTAEIMSGKHLQA